MKKTLTLLTTICLFVTLSGVGYAEDSKSTTVTYKVTPSYYVTIPSEVKLGEKMEVKAENVVIGYGQTLNVKINSDFTLSNNNHKVSYSITSGTKTIKSEDIILTIDPEKANNGSTSLSFIKPDTGFKYAGDYSGTVNFTISVT